MGVRADEIGVAAIWLFILSLGAAGCGSDIAGDHGVGFTRTTTSTTIVSIPSPTTTTVVGPAPSTVGSIPDPPVPLPVTTTTTLFVPVSLEPGESGPAVERLQQAMAEAGFFRDSIDGVFGERTATAVIAVHKALDVTRSASWSVDDWASLAGYPGPTLPVRNDQDDRIEVDLTRQLLYRVQDGSVADIIPISSGNGELYANASGRLVRARTPRGSFTFYKQYDGWRISYLGGLYRPWYFLGGYAIHGSASVPPYPASHGCVRVPNWEADYLASVLWVGLPVHVWD
ncbi:MAG: murein L,D-transpeptidase [Acidimicrobiia bacterium]|nr:murein L,D-transpeptidase [Acidimicrobiia bacterium]